MAELNLCIFCGKEPEKPRQYGYQIAPRRNKCYCIDHSCDNGLLVSVHGFSREEVVERWNKIMPAADVAEVRHARWEECDYIEPCVHGFGTIRHTNAGLKCSNCVNVFRKDLLWKGNYCPNCGAKMDLEV